jgi:hypothetical protein
VTVTVASLKARFTEIAPTDDTVVQGAIDEAVATGYDARLFGDRFDNVIALEAMHLLSISPGGQQARLQKNSIETTYSSQRDRLIRIAAGGPWTIGQVPQ